MVQKRLSEEFDDCSVKQPRYSEPGDWMILKLDTVDGNAASHLHHYLGLEGFSSKTKHQSTGRPNSSDITEKELLSVTSREIGRSLPGSLGNSSWATSEENIGSDASFRRLLSPDHYNYENHFGIIAHPRILSYSRLDIPPQKMVPLGIDFQAEIPESSCDGSSVEYNKFEGTCVIPMPELDAPGNGEKPPGSGRTECSCEDKGSIRCVKQHVEESRVTLRTVIGTKAFCKLGLGDMGEAVAEKWNSKEKEIFREVIYSNPESLGMNFWDQLAKVFPSRTKKEIVSFYFNVFILRKRAEQNRCNVRDIDSDNDELESNDDLESNEEIPEKIYKDDSVSELQAEFVCTETYSLVHANKNFVNQETTSEDMVNQSILNPSSHFVLHDKNETYTDDVRNEHSDIYYTGEVNGFGVKTGTRNTCVDSKQQDPDCQNGVSTTLYKDAQPVATATSEKGNGNKNWSSKDDDEHDPQDFPENEGRDGFSSKTQHQCNGRLVRSELTEAELLSFTYREMGRSLSGSLLDIPQQKRVPLGMDFQAEIPESGWYGSSEEYNKFEGTCVIPMPELDDVAGNGDKLPGSGRTECLCEDIGSIRCVEQHVEESQIALRRIIGTESFRMLGLDEMGEVVAEKWSEDEIETFHEVIYSNPESLGMNFWDQLAKVFPSRSKKEIVSFYFNVFILRKRAEQNRCSLRDIDSDNDEIECADEVQGAEYVGTEANEENIHANSVDHANEKFLSEDMVNQSILYPSSHFVFHDENEFYTDGGVLNGCSDIYYTGELNGAGVETGSCNTCVDGKQQGMDCLNGVSALYENGRPAAAAVSSEKGNCNRNWSGEQDPLTFPEYKGFLLPTHSVIEVFTD